MKQRTFKGVFTIILAVFVALATGGAVMAFSSGPPPEFHPIPASDSGDQVASGDTAATNCRVSYSNGSGSNQLDWCFSDDGNVVSIEHGAGLEHVNNGTITEGWCIAAGGTVRGITYGSDSNVGLKAPTYPSPDKVRHNTTDGSLRVESRFSTSPGNKQIVVKMNVRNNTDSPINDVFLTRFIDPDMSNTTGSDDWSSTVRSVTAMEAGSSSLQLFPKTSEFNANSLIYPSFLPILDGDCYDADSDSRLSDGPGDRSMGVMYQLGTIFPGQTRTVQYVYRITN